MIKVFICTAGTSIATNKGIDIRDIENRPRSEKPSFEIPLIGLRQSVERAFSQLNIRNDLDHTSAEIKSLAKMGLESGDKVYLLVSDTIDGEVCAELNKKYLEKEWNCSVLMEFINGLQPLDSHLFKRGGLKNFLARLIHLIEEHQYQDLVLNATAGYKSVIPYITLLGMIYDKPIKYIYEKSSELITLERIPVNYEEQLILEVESKLAQIEQQTEIEADTWYKGIPYNRRGRYSSIVEESRPGFVTMSGVGLLFFEKFKTDYPPDLEKDATPPINKGIKLREDHGKDLLMDFAQKLVKSPYVKEVVNSLPFNPKQREPIKTCHEDGKIEIVLTSTDKGFGLVIQTTGKNMRETEQIAKLLRGKYFR